MQLSKIVQDLRINWAKGDALRDEGLKTPDDILRFDDISYGPYGKDNLLDIYVLKGTKTIQPTIVNIHGGGWVYGNKEVYQYYCMSLAQRGFTVVNINYRLAPETRFPGAVCDINNALKFIENHGAEYFVDKDRLILVGDSAGGQLVSHFATILTNPGFAKLFDFEVAKVTVKALGLNCGTYDGRAMATDRNDEVFLEYIDCMDKTPDDALVERVDALKYMNSHYPPSYIMSTECDFLLPCAQPMYDYLTGMGVPCEIKIYGDKNRPEIGHVFHVNCKLPEAKICNDDECEFFKKYV
ncbi:MAG: alpha/beta hydrolase [Ruminococcus sp.]|nr:alpha/beta hydrolase [Ruminococcus sp.]